MLRRVAVAGDRAARSAVIAAYGAGRAGAVPGPRSAAAELRDLWPEVVDNLASGVRAGLSLPEALTQLGVRGPEELRRPFARFGEDYRATGRFDDCLDRLKAALADPVGDRIVESLRMAREVGGTDLGRLLRTLSAFLREDARTRAELETRQGWTVNAARLAVAAPWIVLALLSLRPEAVDAYDTRRRASSCSPSAAALSPGRLPGDGADRPAAGGGAGAAVSAARSPARCSGCSPALGLALAVGRLPVAAPAAARRPARAVPARRDPAVPAAARGRDALTPFPTLERHRSARSSATPSRLLERVLGGAASVRRRLEQAGRGMTLEEFRAEQVVWGGGGLLAGLVAEPVLSPPTAASGRCRCWSCCLVGGRRRGPGCATAG